MFYEDIMAHEVASTSDMLTGKLGVTDDFWVQNRHSWHVDHYEEGATYDRIAI
jgi:hypothetical protein